MPTSSHPRGRTEMKARTLALGLVALAVLAVAAAAGASHTGSTASGTVAVDESFDLKTADPQRQFEVSGGIVAHVLYDTLLRFVRADVAHPRPSVATAYKASNGARTYTFTLRKDVRFSDGTRLTAKDVVFSFRRLINLKAIRPSCSPGSPCRAAARTPSS